MKLNYKDIVIVEDFDEAEEFRYEHNDEPVEVGTPVGYDRVVSGDFAEGVRPDVYLTCFDGIYFQGGE